MKALSISCMLLAINIFSGYSQNQDDSQRSLDFRLSYGVSFISGDGQILLNTGALVPYGIGLNLALNLNSRITSDFGLTFMFTDKTIYDTRGLIIYDGYSKPMYGEWRDFYINIPIHINYKLLDFKPFKFLMSAGPELIINHHRYYFNPGWDGLEHNGSESRLGAGLEFGLIEWIKVTNKVGIFASQYYGKLFIGDLKNTESVDLKIGLTYRFK